MGGRVYVCVYEISQVPEEAREVRDFPFSPDNRQL